MKRRGIIHPQLMRIIAEMGHADELAVVDAGFPIPTAVERVDLAFAPGHPGMLEVVSALVAELCVEGYVVAEEAQAACPEIVSGLERLLPGLEAQWVTHEDLKSRSRIARAVVRTGEFTPYANVALRSGVAFP